MKCCKFERLIFPGILIVVVSFCLFGCEDNGTDPQYNNNVSVGSMSIRPSTITLYSTDTYTVLTVSGGTPPYSWNVSDKSLGTVPANSTANVITYTLVSSTYGANVITVNDANNWTASAIVYQSSATGATTRIVSQ